MVLDGNFDTTTVAEPFIEVFSAGNSGFGGLTAPKEGKNLIVAAASLNYRAGNIDLIADFSSRGPAVDGRWVPTIAAPGGEIASTRNDEGGSCGTAISGTNGLYSLCSGTSMAAPHASGAIVLATEWWRSFNAGADPSPAMATALLVNGAVDMGAADIPNINEGWGRVNVTHIIDPDVNKVYYDQPLIFANTGEQWTLQVGVTDPAKPLKVTLAWADAPGAVGANPALVNDLDLTVVNGSDTFQGNVFSGGWSQTGGTKDSINNLENVYVRNPVSSATIAVSAANIAGDAILYNEDSTDQSFALICSNCALFPDFALTATPNSLDICTPADAHYAIDVDTIMGYDDPVTLSATGNPPGTSASFSANPVTPPGNSLLTISNTGAAAAGSYSIDVVGLAPTSTHTATVDLSLFDVVPTAPTLTSPPDGALNVSPAPTLAWDPVPQARTYSIEIATDANFANIVESASGITDTSYSTAMALNTGVTYSWRVWADNACGTGNNSDTFAFTTQVAPGDCHPGSLPIPLLSEDFESDPFGWTTGGPGTTWSLNSGVSEPHSGAFVYHADNVAFVTDQYLLSPAISLPTSQGPLTLQFWNYQDLEARTDGCYDGGVLEITTDGGTSWTRLESQLLTDPYDGPISTSYANPLAGQNAWCGDPQTWLNSIVDIDAFAGQKVQFRWRLATDSSVSRPGWDIDDVAVQACSTDCSYDLNSSGSVDIVDVQTVAAAWGTDNPAYDFNDSGSVDAGDIQMIAQRWGTYCEATHTSAHLAPFLWTNPAGDTPS
jgi:hypothetical protein